MKEDPEVAAFLRKTNREIADILFEEENWYQKLDDAGKDLLAEIQAASTLALFQKMKI